MPMHPLPLSAEVALTAGFGELRHTKETGSTNDDLAAEARLGDRSPAVLVADHQNAGRGRLGRRWSDAATGPHQSEAALLVSIRLQTPLADAYDCVAAVSASALAAATDIAKRSRSDAAEVLRSKWPNDLLICSHEVNGKLAGVLSETVAGDPPVVVVGLGMNLAAAPDQSGAVALAQLGVECNRDQLLARLLQQLPAYLAAPDTARSDLRAASATLGSVVKVLRADGEVVVGTAIDIDATGRLVLKTRRSALPGETPNAAVGAASQTMLIETGDVIALRDGDSGEI